MAKLTSCKLPVDVVGSTILCERVLVPVTRSAEL